MSDVSATPVAGTPAANAADSGGSPTTAPAGAPAETPKDNPQAELEAVLRKMGGIEVKAGGKTHKVDSLEKLMRYAQRGLPVEQSLSEVARARAELEPVQALLQQLQAGDEDAAEQALEKLLEGGKLDKVAERRLRRIYEKEQELEKLSPREREYAAELERERSQRQKLEADRKAFEERQAAAQEQAQVEAIKGHIGTNISKALETMGLPAKLEPMAVEFMKPIIRASLEAGMPLDPAVLAEKVGPLFDEMLSYKAKNLEGEHLLKFLGDDVGRKVRKALLAQLKGGDKTPAKPVEVKVAAPTGPAWDPRKMF